MQKHFIKIETNIVQVLKVLKNINNNLISFFSLKLQKETILFKNFTQLGNVVFENQNTITLCFYK